uniref:Uncharacterized protein n=1 Tax=Solibacter usitatus (strain Ellin6076) TaxID=234267 RepID=Q02CC7_SOLUE
MRFNSILDRSLTVAVRGLVTLWVAGCVLAQTPVGLKGFTGSVNDYWVLRHLPDGDTSYFQAWGSDGNGNLPSISPYLADPSGLTVLGTINDGHMATGAAVNIGILQLSKLAAPLTTATTGNTNVIDVNAMTSFGDASSISAPSGTWAGHCTGGDGHNDCTWKGGVLAFRNNRLFIAPYRQPSAGGAWGDTTLVMSPDAGQTWVDYGRYNTWTVSNATCSGTTATLTTSANTLGSGAVVYVHDVGSSTAGVYNGKRTLTAASGTSMSYTVSSCAGGTYTGGGAVGPLAADGSAPLGPSDASYPGNILWPQGSPMQWLTFINYGQDGAYPGGVEPACDPAQYLCGISTYKSAGGMQMPNYAWRVPVGQEMNKASYQWYTCPGYSWLWPSPETVCDGNRASSWSSNAANAANLFYSGSSASASAAGLYPEECYSVKFSPAHGSYIMACESIITPSYTIRMAYKWAPHPWGPWSYAGYSDCAMDASQINCSAPFQAIMGFGETVISRTPPEVQNRLSTYVGLGVHSGNGSFSFWTANFHAGRLPAAGMARRAEFLGTAGQLGMGHRFVSGNMAGAISRRGPGYSLDWWADLWDHGGNANTTSRPWFRDVMTGGSRYFQLSWNDGNRTGPDYSHGSGLSAAGPTFAGTGYQQRMEGNFQDTTFSANSGNASWTVMGVFSATTLGGILNSGVFNSTGAPWQVVVSASKHAAGDLCVAWGTNSNHADMCTAGGVLAVGQWYFIAISAMANASGYPTITMYVGAAGTVTEYGGISMATSATGTRLGNLTKTCATNCSTTPTVGSDAVYLALLTPGMGGYQLGTLGEFGLYSGVVPGFTVREIYRTLRADWARVGRGSI